MDFKIQGPNRADFSFVYFPIYVTLSKSSTLFGHNNNSLIQKKEILYCYLNEIVTQNTNIITRATLILSTLSDEEPLRNRNGDLLNDDKLVLKCIYELY